MLLSKREVELHEYEDASGVSPFTEWSDTLNVAAALKIITALERMATGHQSSMKAVGKGVSEYKIDFGPGYRIYFAKDGDTVILLLGGGTKKKQQRDIAIAQERWNDYKRRKKVATKGN
jgi:putative addiction module killer protein